ncbi:citrate synthase [Saccharopolyspora antimicrobica]|uniref:citrate synthase (unknown stereospecificity) n=1 Tax=Saccharopolyspora antimicrobica TaxID=455193 RepID=A0A1I5GRW9_9PSEU|nr:citryl-CoA lyase [Saccharopolyspora antimicrobica]RKT87386.1 citrate synthase [Saccharopolyspora antimicrobica]SFO38677.1 citrate synthase [Saccharopolyspora antimicrobica]
MSTPAFNTTQEYEDAVTGWWRTGISRIRPGEILLRGYPVEELIGEVSFVDAIWLMLRGDLPAPGQRRLLEAALVAAVDHGPQAPSIAAARMAATCGLGLNNAVATGVNLLGDVHGGAGQQCMQLLADLAEAASGGGDLDAAAERLVADHRASGNRVPGFGHRFHPRDPRRDPLLTSVERAVARNEVPGWALRAGTALERALAQGRSRPVPMNIDGATAIVYSELGFPPELGRGLFVLARSVGILSHAWEEKSAGARIKGPIPRPLLPDYNGPGRRDLSNGNPG